METLKLEEMDLSDVEVKTIPEDEKIVAQRIIDLRNSKRVTRTDINPCVEFDNFPRLYPFWYVNAHFSIFDIEYRFNGKGYNVKVYPNGQNSLKASFRPDENTEIIIDTVEHQCRENLIKMLAKYNVFCDNDLKVFDINNEAVDNVFPRLEIEQDAHYEIIIEKADNWRELNRFSCNREEMLKFIDSQNLLMYFAQYDASKSKKKTSSGFTH